mmetsp:Transcript_29327/g.64059  ORF Transcript_29327/g.64059 Transcript_29327/m.64059 type:complete len:262 (+) Transcript_29327:775-1560(+)
MHQFQIGVPVDVNAALHVGRVAGRVVGAEEAPAVVCHSAVPTRGESAWEDVEVRLGELGVVLLRGQVGGELHVEKVRLAERRGEGGLAEHGALQKAIPRSAHVHVPRHELLSAPQLREHVLVGRPPQPAQLEEGVALVVLGALEDGRPVVLRQHPRVQPRVVAVPVAAVRPGGQREREVGPLLRLRPEQPREGFRHGHEHHARHVQPGHEGRLGLVVVVGVGGAEITLFDGADLEHAGVRGPERERVGGVAHVHARIDGHR